MRTTIFLFLVSLSSMTGFSQNPQTHEYLSMTQSYDEIKISKSSGNYEIINIKSELSKNLTDFGPLLRKIQEYEEQGYEIVSNSVFTTGSGISLQNHVLMRRKK